jgi:hypothetical protein
LIRPKNKGIGEVGFVVVDVAGVDTNLGAGENPIPINDQRLFAKTCRQLAPESWGCGGCDSQAFIDTCPKVRAACQFWSAFNLIYRRALTDEGKSGFVIGLVCAVVFEPANVY